ncbi:NAD(P)-dependent alcohol dehydrogenase [Cytophaga sp. FL35]|uniref:NAD(P)-dependent alcohol dehydrogenase n=1 Tax=Cytophaga sp. FL35 TaxID=1904456 RepID=UPI0016536EF4|nr:NAD(P)-dependent alcohol dehydrogenase [Cytophaga sp. FL35]MBC7000449.1 NAD(P)-dependent alcohol dehydrogenase [Cytophaga sp. FL35]
MKALCYSKYGRPRDIFTIKDVPIPKIESNEILVQVKATTVNRTDEGLVTARYYVSRFFTGLAQPKKQSPGTDFSGVIIEIGQNVKQFKVGDRVFGFDDEILSSHSHFMTIEENDSLLHMPSDLDFVTAAACCEGAHYALNCINKLQLKEGQKVMVNGGTGAIGSAAIQILKSRGLNIVATAATEHLQLVKNLGADTVIDYTREDFTRYPGTFDLVLDAVGKSSFRKCKKLLAPKGVYISTELGKRGANIFWALITPLFRRKRVIFPIPSNIKDSLNTMKVLIENGQFHPLIDKIYPFEKIVDAYEYVSSGQKVGNVVIQMEH